MGRLARKRSKTGIYHVMLRGINRQNVLEDESDKQFFLETLKYFEDPVEDPYQHQYRIYAYCLMSNHVHIIFKEENDDVSTVIKKICARYVFWYNKKNERCGHLFQERFKSEAVESESYFLTVVRYIHQNPIKAGMVKKIKDYTWTSYNEYVNKRSIIDVEFGLNLFSLNREKAIESFIKFHKEFNNDKCLDYEDYIKLTDNEVKLNIST